jgi:GTP-binding protein
LGKIQSGIIRVGDALKSLDTDGKDVVRGKCTKIITRKGLVQESINEATAGDIVSIAGIDGAYVNHTICDPKVLVPLPYIPVDEPTISIMFYVNDSPLGGKEGTQLTSQVIRDRLRKELETNVSLQVIELNDAFQVKGRGELQMGVLIETMRREGFEISVSAPQVLYKAENDGDKKIILEPIEEVTIDIGHEYAGIVIEKMTKNKGEMKSYTDSGDRARLIFEVPTRGILGYPSEFKTDTHGEGVLNHMLIGYQPYKGRIEKNRKGSLISTASGEATTYALQAMEARGTLFIKPGTQVYPGMIVGFFILNLGEHSRDSDLEVNPVKAKQLTNIRTTSKDETIKLIPVPIFSLEKLIAYIQDDEVIEVTPTTLRSRKRILDSSKRKAGSKKVDFGV